MSTSAPSAPGLTRAERTQLHLSETAMEIFTVDGDTSATVEQICAAARVTPRTFHRHFPAKEDVVLPVLRRSSARAAAAVRQIDPDKDPVESLTQALLTEIHGGDPSPQQRRFFFLIASTPEYRSRWLALDPQLREALSKLFHQHHPDADALLRHVAPSLVLTAARATFDHWLTTAPDEPVAPLLYRSLRLALHGLAQPLAAAC